VVSLLSIAYAVLYSHSAVDGTRGGALATALSLFIVFGRYDVSPAEIALLENLPKFREWLRKLSPEQDLSVQVQDLEDDLKGQIGGLQLRLNRRASHQEAQNLSLAMSTVIGTLFWGFGDIPTNWLIRYFSCSC
jgi:hypothetical protein